VVTHQLQVEHRTAKAHRPKTDALPLDHATNEKHEEEPILSIGTSCRELCKNGLFAIWIVDSGGPKEAQVQSCSPGGANVPTLEVTLAPPGEYD